MAVKKQWYEVMAPDMFGGKVVAETPAVDPKYLPGRVLSISMAELGDFSHFFVKLRFQIDKVDGNKAYTKYVGHDILRDRVYRMVQRKTRKVETIVDAKTKDGIAIRIKLVMALIRRVNTSLKDATRKKATSAILEKVSEMKLEDLAKDMISGKFQKGIREQCTKIYPVAALEIRRSELIQERMKQTVKRQTKKIYLKTEKKTVKKGKEE